MDLLPRLLYRDALMLVIDKPAGIPVHKGTGGGENLEQHFDALRFGLPRVPSLAHRLDKETSGCLVLGRHRQALNKLGKLFANNKIEKTYWAVVRGRPQQDAGTLDMPLARQSENKSSWRMKPDPGGDSAITHYQVIGASAEFTWLELKPVTGRTHQLRVHCAASGFCIVGDYLYGTPADEALPRPGLQLHARAIRVPLYASKEPVAVIAEPPAHMHARLEAMGLSA